jgi:hypothetical protein
MIGQAFLQRILLQDPYRTATANAPISIAGGTFGDIDLSGSLLSNNLALDDSEFTGRFGMEYAELRSFSCSRCVFRNTVNFTGARASGSLFLNDASASAIDFTRVDVKGDVNLFVSGTHAAPSLRSVKRGRSFLGDVNLGGSHVDDVSMVGRQLHNLTVTGAHLLGSLDLAHASVSGKIDAGGSRIDDDVFLDSGRFNAVNFTAATIGRSFNARDAVIGPLGLNTAEIGKNVFLDRTYDPSKGFVGNGRVGTIDLDGTRVGGSVLLSGARGTQITGSPLELKGDLNISGATFDWISLEDGHIGGTLWLVDASIATLDLTSTKIDSALDIENNGKGRWREPGALILRNTSVRTLEDRPGTCAKEPCPDPLPRGCPENTNSDRCVRLDLVGFSYATLGERSRTPASGEHGQRRRMVGDMTGRDLSWWSDWLRREPYSPQPYEQLASALRQAGRPEAATAILYESKNREASSPDTSWTQRALMFLSKALIGYGYYPQLAGIWAIALILAGVLVLELTHQLDRLPKQNEPRVVNALIYSFDALIPLVTLRKDDDAVVLDGFARYWFYAQKIFGYVLATFLVAGISGLTK